MLIDEENETTIRDWSKLEDAVKKNKLNQADREVALIHTANILSRSFVEVMEVHKKLGTKADPERLFKIVYWLGKLAIDERTSGDKRTITFSNLLRERLGHHVHGERWANTIKETLHKHKLLERPLHIISSNMHSVLNLLFARKALEKEFPKASALEIFEALSQPENEKLRTKVQNLAAKNGMIQLDDTSGANIDVQIFDTGAMSADACCYDRSDTFKKEDPVLLVMDYAFGEQAFESVDELLKPFKGNGELQYMDVRSISIMGKAGILQGDKSDLMIPSAHIFEGTADNYPFENELCKADFEDSDLNVYEGTMVTVLGTSLQNKDILTFFLNSTWNVIGLEMEGVHYQKAIQSASRIRKSIRPDVKVRYAYYASDNPLKTGHTLASGGLGTAGVKPTYVITDKILMQILNS